MAILRSLDGQFYEIPDDQVAKFLIPAEKVKEMAAEFRVPRLLKMVDACRLWQHVHDTCVSAFR